MKKADFRALIERDIIPYQESTPLDRAILERAEMGGDKYRQLAYVRRDRAIKGVQVTEVWMIKMTRQRVRDVWHTECGRIISHYYTRDNYELYMVGRQTMGWSSYDTWHVGETPHRASRMTWISDDIMGYCQGGARNSHIPQLQGIDTARWCVTTIRQAMQDNQLETLMRYCHTAVHRAKSDTAYKERMYKATKIAVRNRYKTSQMWCDYIELCDWCGLDIRNPRYVCPADLKAEHDRLLALKQRREEQEKRRANDERRRAEAQKRTDWIRERTERGVINIAWASASIQFATLNSVEEYYQEGSAMHHCVYQCGYWKKYDSIIISARDLQGNRLETVEYSIGQHKVLQSRAVCNGTTPQHDAIIQAVETMLPTLINPQSRTAIAC